MIGEDHPGSSVVGHITRASLQPTETFIHNQVANLRRYEPVMICHHRGRGRFSIAPDLVAGEMRRAPAGLADTIGDRILRRPLPGTLDAMARYLEQRATAVLHFHFLVNARSYLGVKEHTNLPAVVSAYGYDVTLFPRRAAGLGRRYLTPIFSRIECFLALSDQMRRDLVELGCPEDRIRIHHHGVETERFACTQRHYDRAQPLTILSSGRLIPTKGHAQLIEALAVVRQRCPVRFRLVIVGEGPLRPRLERRIASLGMSDVVELVGHVPYEKLGARYRDADVFALPCVQDRGQREGLPAALIEAMAAGLPIVSSRHGGIPSVVTDGRQGLLVPEGDVGRLAEGLQRVLGDPELRRRVGTAAAVRAVRELDVGPAADALEQIYDELRAGAR